MSRPQSLRNIKDLSLSELGAVFAQWGFPPFHARQIFHWFYQKKKRRFEEMSNLPATLRQKLQENFLPWSMRIEHIASSRDGTQKFLLGAGNADYVEAVSIPAQERVTGCISTQVGCKFSCRFCASGLKGFARNLTTAEMIEEALFLRDDSQVRSLTHIVFMGTGEPLDNYENLLKAIRIMNDKEGLHIGARRITISTCGILPGIRRLAEEDLQVELSISLHATNDKTRTKMLPINKKYPLKELMKTCKEYIRRTRRQITFEYVLMEGVNSDLKNAQNACTILQELRLAKINLIPANPIKELGIKPPERPEILFFKDYLTKHGVVATLRKSRGADIDAACGQLRLRHEKE
ncbi:MAG: 23S rRNA (adenine(2503)-C(2))-methyltransferase RlmN [Candidatus Omnitrophica bacterium]|nr:23S rRNA (adenine(2503)-C(2))-methyltransferase RlmN [Candidatus Omnitrophota bacterium]